MIARLLAGIIVNTVAFKTFRQRFCFNKDLIYAFETVLRQVADGMGKWDIICHTNRLR